MLKSYAHMPIYNLEKLKKHISNRFYHKRYTEEYITSCGNNKNILTRNNVSVFANNFCFAFRLFCKTELVQNISFFLVQKVTSTCMFIFVFVYLFTNILAYLFIYLFYYFVYFRLKRKANQVPRKSHQPKRGSQRK